MALDGAEGFLPDSEGGAGLREGDFVSVRVTRAAQGGKGPRLTARLGPDEVPPAGRPAARCWNFARYHSDALVEVDDGALAARLKPSLGDRVHVVAGAFDDGIEEQVQALEQRRSTFPVALGCTFIPRRPGGDRRGRGWRDGRAARQDGLASGGEPGGVAGAGAGDPAAQPVRCDPGGLCRADGRSTAACSRLACTPRWPTTRCGRGCSASPRSVWPRSSGAACIRRCTSCSPVRMPRGWRRCAGLRQRSRHSRSGCPCCVRRLRIVAALQADAEALPDLARRAGRALIMRSDPTLPATGWTT